MANIATAENRFGNETTFTSHQEAINTFLQEIAELLNQQNDIAKKKDVSGSRVGLPIRLLQKQAVITRIMTGLGTPDKIAPDNTKESSLFPNTHTTLVSIGSVPNQKALDVWKATMAEKNIKTTHIHIVNEPSFDGCSDLEYVVYLNDKEAHRLPSDGITSLAEYAYTAHLIPQVAEIIKKDNKSSTNTMQVMCFSPLMFADSELVQTKQGINLSDKTHLVVGYNPNRLEFFSMENNKASF